MKPYVVGLLFGEPGGGAGMLCVSAVLAASPETATAGMAAQFTQQTKIEMPLIACQVQLLTVEFLREALNPGGGKLVNLSVYQQAPEAPPEDAA